MSIESALLTLAANKAAIKAAISAKSPSTEPTDDMSQWPASIASIGGGVHEGWIYGYVIDESDSNPATRVTYIEDNADFDPLYMDFSNDALVWGDWQDFVEEYFRPAMLKSDGTIDYYLDPDDLTKKADGVTASDVANTSYDGNAMLIVKPIFYNIGRIGTTRIRVRFSNVKQGDDWFNWTHLKSDGTYADFCGWPLFEGSVISSKLRSISGTTPNANNRSLSAQYSLATANGSNWHLTTFADETFIRMLAPLFLRSTDSEGAIGKSPKGTNTTGLLNGKGYFYGSSSSVQGNKFLCMENVWGNMWRRPIGCINYGDRLFVKFTPSGIDGTNVQNFASSSTLSDYSNYHKIPYSVNTYQGGNCVNTSANPFTPLIPTWSDGSTTYTTYYCDYIWWTRGGTTVYGVCFAGGGSNDNGAGGIFATGGNIDAGSSFSSYNASLSYHFY